MGASDTLSEATAPVKLPVWHCPTAGSRRLVRSPVLQGWYPNSGFNRFGFDAPDSLYKALSDCRDRYGFYCSGLIFRRLYDLNSRAYAGRYKTDADTTPPKMPSVPPLVQEREREDQHEKLLPWHYKLAKLIDCEIYQASEDATRKDPLLLALIDFSRVYTHFLVSNTADYNAAPWGTI